MSIREKTKYQVMLKLKNGEPLTSKRSWVHKPNALEHIKNSLDTGSFAWGALLCLHINGSLIGVEEYYF